MPPINAMQANAGFLPYGAPDMPPLVFPMGAPGAAASPGQVSAMLQQQMYAQQYAAPQPSMMMGGTTMQSPFRGGFGGPPSMFGRAATARQTGISSAGTLMGGAEATMGLLSTGLAMIPAVGMPLSLGVEAISSATFGAFNAQRERALAMQNQSLGYVFGGGMMSQTGQGMGMQQARMISSGLGRMADSASFKQDTGGMMNRADLDRLTRIAGESGMLNNTQSPQQVLDAVRKISKQVTTFMSVLEEPDFQRAMQRMGQLHQMGVRLGDMGAVAANTRTFARMAGVTADQAMSTAVAHAQQFQQSGMSVANGINASLGAQGFGRQIASVLDNRTLSMMGGVEGVQNELMAATTRTFSNPLLMASALHRGENGRLHASGADFLRNLTGPTASIADLTRRGASNMRGLGGRRAIAEVLANQNHLRDGMLDELSPEQMMLANIRMAQLQQRQAGGSLEENIYRMTGSEEQTRAMMTLVRDPRAMAAVRDQMRISARDRAVGTRDRQLANQSQWMQRAWDENIANPIGHSLGGISEAVGRWTARNQERAESLALQGTGRARALDGDHTGTAVTAARVSDIVDSIGTARDVGAQARNRIMAEARRHGMAENQRALTSHWGDLSGADGFGFTAAQRGGDSLRQTVLDGASVGARFRDSMIGSFIGGERVSTERMLQMANSQAELGDAVRRSRTQTAEERGASTRSALSALGEGNEGRAGQALVAASEAARAYFDSREGMFGMTDQRDMHGMKQRARAAMMREGGVSAAEADRLLESQEFLSSVTHNVRRTGSAAAQRQLAAAETQGASAREALHGQSGAGLRSAVSSRLDTLRSTLGMAGGPFGMGQASDADVGRVRELLTTTGEDDELRREIYTAAVMANSSDRATAERGRKAIDDISAKHPDKQGLIDNTIAQVNQIDEGTREDMGDAYKGRTMEEALRITQSQVQNVDEIAQGQAAQALESVLGEAGAAGYSGDASSLARLRRDPSSIRSRNIRRLVDNDASDEDLLKAIRQETRERARSINQGESVGAGEEDSGSEGATDDMITDIQAGLAEFPEATQQLSSAAEELRKASEALNAAAQSGAIGAAIVRAG